MKSISTFLLLFFVVLGNAQQNLEFKQVKDYYDYQRLMIGHEFKKKLDKEANLFDKNVLKDDLALFMSKMDSIQNTALIGALISVKNREDLSRNNIAEIAETKITPTKKIDFEKIAEYPGGIDLMRQQVNDLFYTAGVKSDTKTLKTNVEFIVEEDGSVSSVHAFGDNFNFNRQAEIAMYMLPEKFSPAMVAGKNVRYRYRLPLTMDID